MRTDGSASISPVLAEAAFGATPGRWPLPTASGPVDRWHRAVALGGQGHYLRAHAELSAALRDRPAAGLRSLIWSTAGSLHRQLGWHARARALDGRARAESGPITTARPQTADAVVDALVGLAADALGSGRSALAERLLDSVSQTVADYPGWRAETRLSWVRAELALARGEPAEALDAARAAEAAAAIGSSVRHRIKSALLVAAATAATGSPGSALEQAREVASAAADHGLRPLEWAAAMLRGGLGDPTAAAVADRIATDIAERGGHFRTGTSENIGVLNWPYGPAGYC